MPPKKKEKIQQAITETLSLVAQLRQSYEETERLKAKETPAEELLIKEVIAELTRQKEERVILRTRLLDESKKLRRYAGLLETEIHSKKELLELRQRRYELAFGQAGETKVYEYQESIREYEKQLQELENDLSSVNDTLAANHEAVTGRPKVSAKTVATAEEGPPPHGYETETQEKTRLQAEIERLETRKAERKQQRKAEREAQREKEKQQLREEIGRLESQNTSPPAATKTSSAEEQPRPTENRSPLISVEAMETMSEAELIEQVAQSYEETDRLRAQEEVTEPDLAAQKLMREQLRSVLKSRAETLEEKAGAVRKGINHQQRLLVIHNQLLELALEPTGDTAKANEHQNRMGIIKEKIRVLDDELSSINEKLLKIIDARIPRPRTSPRATASAREIHPAEGKPTPTGKSRTTSSTKSSKETGAEKAMDASTNKITASSSKEKKETNAELKERLAALRAENRALVARPAEQVKETKVAPEIIKLMAIFDDPGPPREEDPNFQEIVKMQTLATKIIDALYPHDDRTPDGYPPKDSLKKYVYTKIHEYPGCQEGVKQFLQDLVNKAESQRRPGMG